MKIPPEWSAETIVYEGNPRIAIRFAKKTEWIILVRKLPGARWCYPLRCWLVMDNEQMRRVFGLAERDRIREMALSTEKLTPEHNRALEQLIDHMRSTRYSEASVRSYVQTLLVFLEYFRHKPINEITKEDVIAFNRDYVLKRELSASYQSQFVNALKLLYGQVIKTGMDPGMLIRPKKPFRLPDVLSEDDVAAILGACENLKHKTMLSLMYSAGLRRGELLNLKPGDIDSSRMMIHIRNGKGARDRLVPLSPLILDLLRDYYRQYRPKEYLFEGQFGGKYSERSIELVLKKAVAAAGIEKNITLHMLRHSYATHLMEAGTNLRYIQELLGHKSPKTTQIYTHVSRESLSKVASPFDRLKLK